jgi:hypothetical protein
MADSYLCRVVTAAVGCRGMVVEPDSSRILDRDSRLIEGTNAMLRFIAVPLAVAALTLPGCHKAGCHKYGRGFSSVPPVSHPIWSQPEWMEGTSPGYCPPAGLWYAKPRPCQNGEAAAAPLKAMPEG